MYIENPEIRHRLKDVSISPQTIESVREACRRQMSAPSVTKEIVREKNLLM